MKIRKGYIWIGTNEGVLNRYDRKTGILNIIILPNSYRYLKIRFQILRIPIPFSRNSINNYFDSEGPDNSLG